MNEKIFKKRDLFLLLAVTAIAMAAFFILRNGQQGNIAVVSYNGAVIQKIPLNKNGIYSITGDLPVTLEVLDGRIRFTDSHCPDLLCEGFGWIGEEYEYAICMPARVAVQIQANGD